MKTPHQLLPLSALLLAGAASCKNAGRVFGPKDEGGIYLILAVKQDPERVKSVVPSQGLELRAVVSPLSPAPIEAREEGAYRP